METMWRFVHGVFGVDENGVGDWVTGCGPPIKLTARSKPDRLSGNFELRRVNIDPPEGCSFDQWHCYELFWQHVFRGHRFRDILDWLGDILDPCRQLGSARLWIVRLFLYAIIALLGIPYLLYIIGPDWVTSALREAVESCWRWITTWDLLASTLRQAREAVEGFWRWIAARDFAASLENS
jgi:hypothetical protein